jgi:hypothetical protein
MMMMMMMHTRKPITNLFQQQRRHISLSDASTIFRNIFSGDDATNPKKILERRYIYFALLATSFRRKRLDNSVMDRDSLYQSAFKELEEKNLDQLRNVELRSELQNALQEQVIDIFQAFERADQRLKLNQEHTDALVEDWQPIKVILEEELRHTESLEEDDASAGFLQRKRGAIETVLSHLNGESSSTSNKTDAVDDFGIQLSKTSDKSLHLIREYQALNLARSALIRQELGYSILTLKSLIPSAGRGVFLDGHALAGSILAFQPGDIWPKEHLLTKSDDVLQHFEEDDEDCLISLRFDDHVLDSRNSPVTVLTRPGSMNPWALGHMINHTPPSTLPNCQSTMLNYTEQMQLQDCIKYIPNTYAHEPQWQSKFFHTEPILMHGLCLIGRSDVKNTELTYDYRIQSDNPPDWYSIVKYDDRSFDTTDQVVFFRDDWTKKKEHEG